MRREVIISTPLRCVLSHACLHSEFVIRIPDLIREVGFPHAIFGTRRGSRCQPPPLLAQNLDIMTLAIDILDLPARLDEAIALASAGGGVTLVDGPVARARLVAVQPTPTRRVPGLHAGAMEASADFDAPLPDEFWDDRE